MPRKVFVAGEILTAADVNTNLMDQAVMSFAGTAARGSAIPSPVEGMVTYLEDTDDLQVYTTGWENVNQPGILQVIQTVKTDTFSTTSTTYVDVTSFNVSITPSSSSSKILVLANVKLGNQINSNFSFSRILRDSTAIYTGDSAGSRDNTAQGLMFSSSDSAIFHHTSVFLDSPNTTSSVTYKIQAKTSNGSFPAYINRGSNDADQATRGRTASSIIVMEVTV